MPIPWVPEGSRHFEGGSQPDVLCVLRRGRKAKRPSLAHFAVQEYQQIMLKRPVRHWRKVSATYMTCGNCPWRVFLCVEKSTL